MNTSFRGLKPASASASKVGRGNQKENTQPELLLGHALRRIGLHFSRHDQRLPGRPDFVFPKSRVAVFCDGDFWHGRRWVSRKRRLRIGHNAPYWVAKIRRNISRDRKQSREIRQLGWRVYRVWESDVRADPIRVALRIAAVVSDGARGTEQPLSR